MNVIPLAPTDSIMFWSKAIASLAVVMAVTAGVLWVRHLRADLAAAKTALLVAQVDLRQKNVILADLSAQRTQLQAELHASKAWATKLRRTAEQNAQRIMNEKIPAGCDGAAAWAIDQAGKLR